MALSKEQQVAEFIQNDPMRGNGRSRPQPPPREPEPALKHMGLKIQIAERNLGFSLTDWNSDRALAEAVEQERLANLVGPLDWTYQDLMRKASEWTRLAGILEERDYQLKRLANKEAGKPY